MGMYNEVFKDCPTCDAPCMIQIPQIVLGFGGFNLSDPDDLRLKLEPNELDQLWAILKDKSFYCIRTIHKDEGSDEYGTYSHGYTCGRSFSAVEPKKLLSCPCCGYPHCGHNHSER